MSRWRQSLSVAGVGQSHLVIQAREREAALGPDQDRQRGIILAEGEDALGRDPECPAEEDPVRSAVRDDGERAARVRPYDVLEGWPRARGKLREILAVGKLIAGDVGHPGRVRVGVERPDLLS